MKLLRHPPGLYVLFLTEMWERFSYYGMRALLMLYMVQGLHWSIADAAQMYGLYTGLVYLTPVLGGYLADRYIGQHRAVLAGAGLMALGHFLLALPTAHGFLPALALLVLGCGLFKPNLSVLIGTLYAPDDPRRDGAFSLFYMGINVGALLAPLVCGTLGQRWGWEWGFGSAGIGMLLGLIVYVAGQRYLQPWGPAVATDRLQSLEAPIGAQTPVCSLPKRPSKSPRTTKAQGGDVDVVLQRLGALALLALFGNVAFWAAFEQAGSSLAIFAEKYCELHIGGGAWAMPSSWYQAFNPLLIIAATPLFSSLWPRLAAAKREPSTPIKFVFGLAMVSIGFCLMRQAGTLVDAGNKVSLLWLLAASVCNTCGELCVSPVGLAVVSRLAPVRHIGLAMGGWLGSVALANLFGGALASRFGQMPHALFFSVPAVTCALAALLLLAFAPRLQRWMHGVR